MKSFEQLISQLLTLNQNYMWIVEQGEKILVEIDKAFKDENFAEVEKLRNKFIELENRHNRDKKTYNYILKESRSYFKTKYGLDLFNYFELEDI